MSSGGSACPLMSILALRWHIARKSEMVSAQMAPHRACILGFSLVSRQLSLCCRPRGAGLARHGLWWPPLYCMLLSPSLSTSSPVWAPFPLLPLCLFIQYSRDCSLCSHQPPLGVTQIIETFLITATHVLSHPRHLRVVGGSGGEILASLLVMVNSLPGREISILQIGLSSIWVQRPLNSAHLHPHPNPHLRCSRTPGMSLSGFCRSSPLLKVCTEIGLPDMLHHPISVIPIFSWLAICISAPSKFSAIHPLGIPSKEGFFLNLPNIHFCLYSWRRLLLQILEISSCPYLTTLNMVWVFVSPTVRLFFSW